MEGRRNRLGYLQDLIATTAWQVVMTVSGIINTASIVAISCHGTFIRRLCGPEMMYGSWILKILMSSRGFEIR
jgi:hypothetical protein